MLKRKIQEPESSQSSPYNPIIFFGKNAHAVPIEPSIAPETIKLQHKTRSFRGISFPYIFRKKEQGSMIETVKQKKEPIRAMILSNEGKIIATTTKTIVTPMRIVHFKIPRVSADIPTIFSESEIARTSRPDRISKVDIIGRALRGIFVMAGKAKVNMSSNSFLGKSKTHVLQR